MNPIVLRLIISFIASIAAYFAIQFTVEAKLGAIAGIVVTFIIVTIALFLNAGSSSASSSSAKGRGAQSNSSDPNDSRTSTSSLEDQETGTVKWFNVKKGYGFITRDSGDDVFVHYRNIIGSGRRSITDGQRVQFVVIDGDKGLQADEVEAI